VNPKASVEKKGGGGEKKCQRLLAKKVSKSQRLGSHRRSPKNVTWGKKNTGEKVARRNARRLANHRERPRFPEEMTGGEEQRGEKSPQKTHSRANTKKGR